MKGEERKGHYFTWEPGTTTRTGDNAGKQHGPSHLKEGVDYINPREEDQMEIYGYKRSMMYTILIWIFILCTGGLLRLVFHWKPEWMVYCTYFRCRLEHAQLVLVVDHYQGKYTRYYVKHIKTLSAENVIQTKMHILGKGGMQHGTDDQLMESQGCSKSTISVMTRNGTFEDVESIKLFHCKKCSYIWDSEEREFYKLGGLDKNISTTKLHQHRGLNLDKQCQRRVVYGDNEIIVPVKSVITLLFLEVLNPFYVFQVFSVCLWYADDYIYYATAILLMSAFGITTTIIQTRKNQKKLSSTIHSSDVATVCRGQDQYESVLTEHLVPGDVIVIPPHGCILHCDAALLSGNCIVNESMLTGESVPVTKTPVPNRPEREILYSEKEHARHTLFCGTKVIQTRYYGDQKVRAVVLRTGFLTAKGSLVRSIMYPPPVDFKFEQDSYRFIGVLAGIASVGFIYTVITKHLKGVLPGEIALHALDLITIVIPPALPMAMTIGILYAQNRLKHRNIYCISPRTISVSGSIDCVCFDKTGTLTEDGLDMWGVVPVEKQQFQHVEKQIAELPKSPLLVGMASCHSLTIINDEITGDPLDLKIFESTTWVLEEPEVAETTKYDMISPTVVKPSKKDVTHCMEDVGIEVPYEVGIIRQFPFSANLQRMSVIVRTLGAKYYDVYCKGSPEMILSLSRKETVPEDFATVLQEYTQHGYRVIALGYHSLPKMSYAKVHRVTREEVECDLIFMGLIILENRLKPETKGIINHLKDANIRTVMLTGDNMLTALSVARECGMIPPDDYVLEINATPQKEGQSSLVTFSYAETQKHMNGTLTVDEQDLKFHMENMKNNYHFAISGKSFAAVREHFPVLMPVLAVRGTVFARMSPEQKQQLIEQLQSLGYYVGMCGDGANDCGALKAAHAGISLSEAESSVASPFTSKEPNISCVPQLIQEGRAALVTSFGVFKYMAAYSLTQFVSVMILYSIESNLSDIEFLYIDLFLITVFAFFFGRTEAYDGPLDKRPPMANLVSASPIVSLTLQISVVVLLQWLAFGYVHQQPWFKPYEPNEDFIGCMENYSVFAVSAFQYIILAVVFSKGSPYRKPIYTNYGFLCSVIAMTIFTVYLLLEPSAWLKEIFELVLPPMDFRLIMIGFAGVNLILSVLIEYLIVDFLIFTKLRYKFHNVYKSKRKYLSVEADLKKQVNWPPIGPRVKEVSSPEVPSPLLPPMEVKMEIATETFIRETVAPQQQSSGGHHHSGNFTSEIMLNPVTLLMSQKETDFTSGVNIESKVSNISGDIVNQSSGSSTVLVDADNLTTSCNYPLSVDVEISQSTVINEGCHDDNEGRKQDTSYRDDISDSVLKHVTVSIQDDEENSLHYVSSL